MELQEILSHVDHTLLAVDATREDIRALCDDAMHYRTASVCIPAAYVRFAHDYCAGRMAICTVIGFPNGYATSAAKAFEARDAVENGADEIDMVIHVGAVKNGDWDAVAADIRAVRAACEGKILKVIIETCLLTDEEKIRLCHVLGECGADYIKTSTGFSRGGATFDDVRLMAAHVPAGLRIKAAGGISSLEDAERFLALGADRLGTSRIVKILKGRDTSNGY
ncbi:MAG: deoxyribose-phosphate aldolase [Clostridiaceae bacterium]|nr:deoxyribose-phosphate aldolase [Clostridiaceae bacterium]